jgi:hypothetical protein
MLHLYFKAIQLLLTTPSLWLKILCPLILFTIVSILLTLLLFIFALVPQINLFLSLLPASQGYTILAYVIAITLVFMEAAVLVLFLSLFLHSTHDRVFDYVLQRYTSIPIPTLRIVTTTNLGARLGTSPSTRPSTTTPFGRSSLWSQLLQVLTYIITIPAGLVPFIGPIIYVLLNGYIQGPMQHDRYFVLKKWDKAQIDGFVKKHKRGYTMLGIATSLMELIPVINIIGMVLNSIVSALYAAELELGEV